MTRIDELRQMARVARLYHEGGLSQSRIAERLHLSQSTISRLLRRAEREGIVRITVSVPNGAYPELEESLADRYGLRHAVVADCTRSDDEQEILRNVGAAAAYYVESTIEQEACVGISSWSSTLLSMVEAMHPVQRVAGGRVVQILGGASESPVRSQAVYLANRLATLIRGEAILLSAPAVVGSERARQILLDDSYVRGVIDLFDQVTLALVGIGGLEPSALLASSGNVFSPQELGVLREHGTVGDVLARFFDAEGHPIRTPLDNRVIGMSLAQLKRVRRSVGVAGGKRKHEAIRGALRGGLVNVLITDRFTAERLVRG